MSREITKKVRKVELSLLCRVCLLIRVYISIKYHLEKFWSYRAYTGICEKLQREITRKVSKLELSHLCAVCLFIWLYICTKYHPNILSSFGVMEQIEKFVKKINTKK